MKIAVDIDDVTIDMVESGFIPYLEKVKGWKLSKAQFVNYSCWTFLGISREEALKLFDDYINSEYHEKTKFLPGAADALRKLKTKHEVEIVTSRKLVHRERTLSLLEPYIGNLGIEIFHSSGLISQGQTKAEICKSRRVDVIIEDSPDYAKPCLEAGIKVILIDQPWNRGIENKEGLYRVGNWEDGLKTAWSEALECIENLNG